MIYLLVLVIGVVGFIGTATLGFPTVAVCFFLGTPVMLGLVWLVRMGIRDSEVRQKRFEVTKNLYELSLKMLEMKPHEPNLRLQCLEEGRAYYQLIIPDTQSTQGGHVFLTTNNSANREARIQADINARVGHLKAS